MKNTLLVIIWFLFFAALPFIGNAQRVDVLIDAPSVVIQGGEFDVTYIVRRQDQKNEPLKIGKEFFDQCNCIFLGSEESSEIKKIKGVRVREISVTCHLKASASGPLILPIYEVMIGRKKIISNETFVQVRPNEEYELEYKAAIEGLKRVGFDTENIALMQCDETPNLMLFSSERANVSIIVASAKHFENLSDPVLMWSDNNVLLRLDEIDNFVSFYNEQLDELFGSNYRFLFKPETAYVNPLLKELSWGIDSPYNIKCPYNKNASRSAVALAQIMSFYRYPMNLLGETSYRAIEGEIIEKDFSNQIFVWEEAMDYLKTRSEQSLQSLGSILASVSIAVHSDFSEDKSWSLTRVPYALINHFDYKSTCRLIRDSRPERLISLLYSEINEQRPALLEISQDGDRQFDYIVCDGYKSDFLHLNFANRGKFNGWYRASLSPNSASHIIKGIVIGIQPNDGRKLEKVVTMLKPNTLSAVLSESDKKEISSLKIIGKISNDDIRLIRRMAGAPSPGEYSWFGQLEKLDLSEATIVPIANTYYLEIDSNDLQKGNTSNSFMNQMIGLFVSRGGCEYDEETKKARYYSVKNVIGDYMFSDCQNLREIQLPIKTTKIGDHAFSGCISLPVVDIPSSVIEIGDAAFAHTWSMQHVNLHANPKRMDASGVFIDSSLNNQGFFLLR